MKYLIGLICITPLAVQALPPLKLAPKLTVSGLSSGGYMANQFHLAYSSQVAGAAILAGGPYYCAQNSLTVAIAHCLNKIDSLPDLVVANSQLTNSVSANQLDSLNNVKKAKVWLFHGTLDTTVAAAVTDALAKQYQTLGADVSYVNNKAISHTFPTDNPDLGSCQHSEAPFLANCQFDAAGALLTKLYGPLQARSAKATGQLHTINQQQLAGVQAKSLGENGYIYIPASCAAGAQCKLHISFHGCKQNAEAVDTQYARFTGLNEYADQNQLVVLYPQTRQSNLAPFNPNACWDWWGYTDANYANQQGPQIQAIMQLAHAIGFASSEP